MNRGRPNESPELVVHRSDCRARVPSFIGRKAHDRSEFGNEWVDSLQQERRQKKAAYLSHRWDLEHFGAEK